MNAIDRQRVRSLMCEARSRGLVRLEELCARALYTDDDGARREAILRWAVWRLTQLVHEAPR